MQEHPATDATPEAPQAPTLNLQPLVDAISPEAASLLRGWIGASEAGHKRTTYIVAVLIAALSTLAGMALFLGDKDTAEKIIIAMVSFLGGTALFGQSGGK